MAASSALPPVTLRYFALPNGLAGRGGGVRFLLLAAGVPVKEDTVDFGQWGAGEAAERARWRALAPSLPSTGRTGVSGLRLPPSPAAALAAPAAAARADGSWGAHYKPHGCATPCAGPTAS